ncbi:MAG: hypothetical protein R3E31_00700 [Chloroflexota bacterium]
MMTRQNWVRSRFVTTWLGTAVLLLSFALALTSIRDKSPTF